MDTRNHEKWIKENIGGRKVQLDSAELWENLQAHVPKKNNRKIFFLLFLGLSAMGLVGLWIVSSNDFVHRSTKVAVVQTETSVPLHSEDIDLIKEKRTTIGPIKNDYTAAIARKNTTQGSNSMTNISPNAQHQAIPTSDSDEYQIRQDDVNSTYVISESSEDEILTDQSVSRTIEVENIPSIIFEENKIDDNPAVTQGVQTTKQNRQIIGYDKLDLLGMQLFLLTDKKPFLAVLHHPKEKVKSGWLGIGGGISVSNNEFRSSESNEELRSTYANNTQSVVGHFLHIDYGYQLNDRWNVIGKIRRLQTVSQIDYSFSTEETVVENGISNILIDQNGLTVEQSGQINTIERDVVTGTWYQFNTNYGLQLGMSYQLPMKTGSRFSLVLESGILLHINNRTTGQEISPSFIVESIRDHYSIGNLSPYVGTGLLYSYSKNISIGLTAEFNQLVLTSNELRIKTNVGTIGLTCRHRL